jgi:hypothetical protein
MGRRKTILSGYITTNWPSDVSVCFGDRRAN